MADLPQTDQTKPTGNQVLQRALASAIQGKSQAELESEYGGADGAKVVRTLASGASAYVLCAFADGSRVEGEEWYTERTRLEARLREILADTPADVVFLLND